MLEQLWNAGFTVAAHLLNKCWRDSMGVLPDDEQAELWFRRAAEAGHDFSQYALGKLLQSQKRMDEAVSRYEKAAAQDNSYADCWLGKLYFEGKRACVSADSLAYSHIFTGISQLLCGAFSGNNFSAKFFSSAASFGASLRSQVRYWYGERGFSLAVSIML